MQVESAGARALALGADVTNASEVGGAVDRTLETFGAIDIREFGRHPVTG